jgi:nucleotide-binding universal stress UspA family protein
MKKQIILVPTDFTKVADCAINHATSIASFLDGEVLLLHVVANKKSEEEVQAKLDKIATDITNSHGIKASAIVIEGNIFEDIGEVAREVGAKLIIMGTHGVKGFQHITGSHALKVITNSEVPFVVVQEKDIKDGYKTIVVPLDLAKETKQKLSVTVDMAKYFGSKVHLIAPLVTDEFLLNTINRNLAFAEKFLQENEIPYDTKIAEEKGSFVKQIIKYAVTIDADLLTIVNTVGSEMDLFASADEQQLITNEAQIPVMCVNPAKNNAASGSVLFT